MRTPADDGDGLGRLLDSQAGVLTWAQATARLSPARVRQLVRTGRWRRVCRGVLVAGGGPVTAERHWWVAVLAAGPEAVLGGLAAATAGGLRGRWRRPVVDVVVPYRRRAAHLLHRLPPELPPVRVHRTRDLPAAEVQVARPPRTTMARSVVDAARWADTDDEARTVVVAACRQRLVTPDEVRATLGHLPAVPRRRLVTQTLGDVAGGVAALAGIDLVRLCRRFSLPLPDRQERHRDPAGRLRSVDAYWARWHLRVEVDAGHPGDAAPPAADLWQRYEVWNAGDRVLRIPAHLVRARPEAAAAQVRAALRGSGWRAVR